MSFDHRDAVVKARLLVASIANSEMTLNPHLTAAEESPAPLASVGRSRLRSRRSICLSILLAAILAWPAYRIVCRVWAARVIESRGGRLVYAPNPPWLQSLIGDRHFPGCGTVTEVSLPPLPRVTNEDLWCVAEFSTIKKLSFGRIFIDHEGKTFMVGDAEFSRSSVTDEGMQAVATLHDLEELSLSDTKVGDAGLVYLASLQKLQILGLDRTRVTDAGMQHLKPLQNLTLLSLRRTNVTDTGITQLVALPQLRSLYYERIKSPDIITRDDYARATWDVMRGGGVAVLLQANPNLKVYWGPMRTEY